MNRNGDIIIIEDDADDRDILIEVLQQVFAENKYTNQVVFIEDSSDAFDYLKSLPEVPFLILSDVNMPKLDGITLRSMIAADEQLKLRCIPYVFLSTSADESLLTQAYTASIQGFFKKPSDFNDYKNLMAGILCYWKYGLTPQLVL